jgi:hypothetical protein
MSDLIINTILFQTVAGKCFFADAGFFSIHETIESNTRPRMDDLYNSMTKFFITY